MNTRRLIAHLIGTAILAALILVPARAAQAHCDGMDGPVVKAAQRALASGDVRPVLVWVQPQDEKEIREAFAHTVAVRKLGAQAKELADRYFFETLVRVHRAGEGAPYTGLKPAGRDLGPAIPAADRALETGDPQPLLRLLAASVEQGARDRFQDAMAAKSYAPDDVAGGRVYVGRYVTFIHYVERLHADATRGAEGHFTEESEAAETHGHDAH